MPPFAAEYILWGDQNEPRIFDFFLENNILTYLHKVLLQPSNRSGEVAKQVGLTHQGPDPLPARLSFDSWSTLCVCGGHCQQCISPTSCVCGTILQQG